MKKLSILLILFIILSIPACSQKAENNTKETELVEVNDESVEAFGVVDCKEKRSVSLDFPVYIDVVNIKEGQKVKRSDQMIKIDPKKVEQKRANMSTLSYMYYNYVICEIDNGVVFNVGCQVGDYVPSYQKLFEIANLDTMIVKAEINEAFIKDVKMDAKVEITPTADKSKKYKGKVTDISSSCVKKSGEILVPVTIEIDKADEFLKYGYSVDISISKK